MNEEQKVKVIEALKEINDILKETNLEMSKILNQEKKTVEKYVIYHTEYNGYLVSHYSDILGDFEHAEVFNIRDALMTIEYLESADKVEKGKLRIVTVKVSKGE